MLTIMGTTRNRFAQYEEAKKVRYTKFCVWKVFIRNGILGENNYMFEAF